jgi:hypothetical protein
VLRVIWMEKAPHCGIVHEAHSKGLMGVKDKLFSRVPFSVGNGLKTRFWENTWLGDTPSAKQYLSLYNIVQRKNV